MSSNYGFEPTLDGLNNIDADSTTTNNIICDNIQINVSGIAPNRITGDNTTNIANTAFVQNAITTTGSNYVTLTGASQTISSEKTFSNANTNITGTLNTNLIQSPTGTDLVLTTNALTDKISIISSGDFGYGGNSVFCSSSGPGVMTFTSSGSILFDTDTGDINFTSADNINITSASDIFINNTTGKTIFNVPPECSVAPTNGNMLCNKDYVDNGAFVTLNTNQTITGQKSLTNFNYIINDTSSGKTGTLLFQDDAGDGALMYYNDDNSTGLGGLRVVSTKYGFAFSSTTGAGEHCDFISQDINFRSTDKCDFTEYVIPPPTGGQLVRGSIYDNTTDRVTFTFSNGQSTDIGVTFNALSVNVPAGNRCNMVQVSIPFDLLAWATFGLPAGSGTVGLRFDSFSVVYLKNGSPFTPFRSESTSSAIGITRNWTKTGTQSNIQGISSYFGNLDIAFGISINNTSTDTYQVRVNPQATITFSPISFDGFKFVCRNATGGQTNGNGFTTTSITAFTGGTLVYGGGNPAFVDTSTTQLSQSYPVPPVTASCFIPLNNNITPPGMISQYAGSTAPQGWLLCNGGSYSITTYPNLYAVISNIYGGSLGTGTFSVPDTRGLFVSSAGSQTLNSVTYTRTLGEKQNDTIEDHKHTYSDMMWWDTDTGGGLGQTIFVAGADFQTPGGDTVGSNGDGNFSNRLTKQTWPSTAVNPGAPAQQYNVPTNVSAITGTETFPANIAFNYIIKW